MQLYIFLLSPRQTCNVQIKKKLTVQAMSSIDLLVALGPKWPGKTSGEKHSWNLVRFPSRVNTIQLVLDAVIKTLRLTIIVNDCAEAA